MSKDIRSFFSVAGGSKKDPPKAVASKNSKGTAKRLIVLSDSDDEESIIPASAAKRSKADSEVEKKKSIPVAVFKKEQKTVNPLEVFGKNKVKRSAEVTVITAPVEEPREVAKKRKKDKRASNSTPGWDDSFSDVDFLSTLGQLDAIEANAIKNEANTSTKTTPEESIPVKITEINGKPNLTLTFKASTHEEPRSKTEKTPTKKKTTAEPVVHTSKVEHATKHEESDVDTTLNETLEKSLVEEDEPSWLNDPAEKRRLGAIGYQHYLNREGPKNLGTKEIPKGKPDCLKGLVFVISGVLDSLERESAVELIQECGGKVTSSLSRKTNYIVLGEDAGPSKVHKAKQHGTKQLDEDGLLDLIREKSGITRTEPKETTSEYFQKSPDKKSESKWPGAVDSKSFYGKVKSAAPCSKTKTKDVGCVQDVSQKAASSSETCAPVAESVSVASKPAESLMWVDKYRPTSTKQIIGQQLEGSNMKRLVTWLQNWHSNRSAGKKLSRPSPWAHKDNGAFYKAALLSGPPGVGKTTTAHLVCKELGFDVVELNASDTRGKTQLHTEVGGLLSNKSLFNYFQGGGQATSARHVLIMDEVDGMAGNEDRGGITELIDLIKTSKVPIICMCNDHNQQKLKTFITYCFHLRFDKPRLEQIQGAMMSICCREGVQIAPQVLKDMIASSSQDVRQILHHLSMYATKGESDTSQKANVDKVKQIKDIKLGPWEVVNKVFSAKEHKTMSMNDKAALFFYNYSLGPLFVQENYLHVVPESAVNDQFKRMDLIAEAADSLCWGDVIDKTIHSRTDLWSLLPTQAMFSSVVPGDLLSGTISRQLGFPRWLGRFSSRTKHNRLEQELHAHTRLATSGSREAFNLDYLGPLRDALLRPLVNRDAAQSVAVMKAYNLMRSDLDSIIDIGIWPHEKDPTTNIDAQVKRSFTSMLNKEVSMLPYSQAMGSVSKMKSSAMTAEGEEGLEEEENEDNDDIAADKMIKAKKPDAVAKKPATAARKPRAKEPAAGSSKTKGTKGRGKSK